MLRKIIIFSSLFFSIPAASVQSQNVILSWAKPDDLRVSGYFLFYGCADTDFKSEPAEIINSPEQTSCRVFGLAEGATYGFAAKSFDRQGNESDFSEAVYYAVSSAQDGNSNHDVDSGQDGGGGGCFIHSLASMSKRDIR